MPNTENTHTAAVRSRVMSAIGDVCDELHISQVVAATEAAIAAHTQALKDAGMVIVPREVVEDK